MITQYLNTDRELISLPLEALLTTGGDSRQILDSLSGLNRYGCSPQSRSDVIALGSCTASSPTLRAWSAAKKEQQILKNAVLSNTIDMVFEESCEIIRHRLLTLLDLNPLTVDVCFSPSGTDGELLALWLALAGTNRSVCSIIVAPGEVGGGTPLAASGFHFSDITPWNSKGRMKGKPVAGLPFERIQVETIPVREAEGRLRSLSEIESQIKALVEEKINMGYRVLLHVVEHSKTGIRAPSLDLVRQLRCQYDNDLVVVVDAAQGRIDRRRISVYVQLGCLVLFTGSKFFCGIPFSGALLVPRTGQFESVSAWEVPVGLANYLTSFEVPPRWQRMRNLLPKQKNVGLLLRWIGALSEMEEYYRHPRNLRQFVLQKFQSSVEQIFADSPVIQLHTSPPSHPNELEHADWRDNLEFEHGVSVFSLSLHPNLTSSSANCLSMATLKHVHYYLHQDVSHIIFHSELTPYALEALRHKFHLGQPVLLSEPGSHQADVCVLRIAMGAALLNQLILDTNLGFSLSDRLDWLYRQLMILRQKLEVLVGSTLPIH